MPSFATLAAFGLASFLIIVIPGPSVLFVVGRSLALGRRSGLLSVLGDGLGGLVLVAAVALGVGGVVAQSIAVFTTVKLAGAAYLAYLGIQAVRHRDDGDGDADAAGEAAARPAWVVVRQGFVVGVTNPKTIVFFVAVLPQFVDLRAGHVPAQMMALGLVFIGVGFACDSAWALVAGSARAWFARSPRRLARVRATGGGMMIGLSGVLALSGDNA